MNLKEALDALLSGREIPPDAREQLTNFDPESLREELSSLKVRFEEQENAKLTAEELLSQGVRDSWVFGPVLIVDGQAMGGGEIGKILHRMPKC